MKEVWCRRSVLMGLVGALLLAMSTNCIVDLDLFHQFALIRETLARGHIPTLDVFSYVPTVAPVVHHEWGTGAILYLVTVGAGLGTAGLLLTKVLLVGAISVGCYFCARREGAQLAVIAPLALIGIALGWIAMTNVRAQLFTLTFLVVLFLFLQVDRRGRRWWIGAWLALYVVWVNLHGGSVTGLLLVVLYGVERFLSAVRGGVPLRAGVREVRHLALVALAMAALMVVNPFGVDNVRYIWTAVRLDRSQLIPEWFPLWRCPDNPLTPWLFLLSVAIGVYAVAKSTEYRAIGGLFLLALAGQALLHYRHLSLYAVAWMCIVPAQVENSGFGRLLRKTWEHQRPLIAGVWLVLLLVGVQTAVHRRFWHLEVPTTRSRRCNVAYPVGAVEYLRSHSFKGNLMVPFGEGAYVSWKLHPNVRVSLDSRFEAAYPAAWVWEVTRLYAGADNWWETLTRYPTDAVLAVHKGPLERLLEESEKGGAEAHGRGWPKVYVDDGYSVFARPEVAAALPFVDRTGERIEGHFP
jgi:hypothetical protein